MSNSLLPARALRLLFSVFSLCVLALHSTLQAAPASCSISSASGVSVSYYPLSPTAVTAMGTITLNCNKATGGSSASTVHFQLESNGGINLSGSQSQVKSGSNAINYGLWRNITHTQSWNGTSNRLQSSVNVTSNNTTFTVNYYLKIPESQLNGVGSYTDTQTVKLYQGTSADAASNASSFTFTTFNINVSTVGSCSLSTPPGNILFNYTSFQTTPASASTSFGVTCVNGVNYTMALDASTGTLLGLNYTLSLNKTGTQTGSGVTQSVSIHGSIAAGQSGTCSSGTCSTTEPRTLTISY